MLSSSSNKLPNSAIYNATVPGTAFVNLLENGTFDGIFSSTKNPYCDQELSNAPDIADVGRDFYTFWYVTRVSSLAHGVLRRWIDFDGINYKGFVFFNGNPVSLDEGMFIRHSVEVTAYWNSSVNIMAVLVLPPPFVGNATKSCPPKNCGQGGNHEMAKNGPIMQMALGWDWVQATPDRNVGIWSNVLLKESRDIRIRDAYAIIVEKGSPLEEGGDALIEVRATIDGSAPATNNFHVSVSGHGKDNVTAIAAINAHEVSIAIRISLKNTSLWWPNGAGDAFLYRITTVVDVNGKQSDSYTFNFGLRTISLQYNAVTKGPQFVVNSRPLFIHGGNWIGIDQLLRLREERYAKELALHASMGFNMIRVWGGSIAERQPFYDAADELGILVWQEFCTFYDNSIIPVLTSLTLFSLQG